MWGDDEDDDIPAAIKASLSVNTESPRAALDNVHHKVQQRYNEEINRVGVEQSKLYLHIIIYSCHTELKVVILHKCH